MSFLDDIRQLSNKNAPTYGSFKRFVITKISGNAELGEFETIIFLTNDREVEFAKNLAFDLRNQGFEVLIYRGLDNLNTMTVSWK